MPDGLRIEQPLFNKSSFSKAYLACTLPAFAKRFLDNVAREMRLRKPESIATEEEPLRVTLRLSCDERLNFQRVVVKPTHGAVLIYIIG